MIRILLVAAVASLQAIAWPVLSDAAEPVTLTHHFAQGQEFFVQKHEDASVEVILESGTSELSHTTDSVRKFRVVSTDAAGNATVRIEIQQVGMKASSSEGTVVYDSTSSQEASLQFKDVAKTIGKPLAEFVVSPRGEVTSIKSLHESVTDVDASSQSLEHPFVWLSDKPVEVGAEWSEKIKLVIKLPEELPQAVNMKRIYKLESVDGGKATVSWRSVIVTPLQDAALEGEVVQRKFDGEFVFDIASGHLVARTAKATGNVVGFQGTGTQLKSTISRSESMTTAEKTAGNNVRVRSK